MIGMPNVRPPAKMVETTIVGQYDEIVASLLRAQEDGRLLEQRSALATLDDGRTAITVAMGPPAVPYLREPAHVRLWRWVTDGGIVWLGVWAMVIVGASAIGLFVVSVLDMLGMVADYITTYGADILGTGLLILVLVIAMSLVGGSRGSGPHCPGPWHR